MRIAMFGGTFNPPHMGHVSAARACVRELSLDRLIFMPACLPPHKALPEETASPQQRLEMTRLAAEQVPGAEVSDIEARRGGRSYTVDTLAELRRLYPEAELWLVVGTDMLMTLENWRESERIMQLASVAAVAREHGERERLREKAAELAERYGARVRVIEAEAVPVSSTMLRRGEGWELLPADVAEYIRAQGLYPPSLEYLRAEARTALSESRLRHTLGCESMAARLAQIYGADEYAARAAALLHDITKEIPLDKQLQLCAEWDIITDYSEENLQLVHADTAAELARRRYRMSGEVVRAIKYHATGSAEMTLLDKIIYTADKCEETRGEYAAPERELALRDLDAAAIMCMERSAEYIRSRGGVIYGRSVQALENLKKRRENMENKAFTPEELLERIVRTADTKKANDIVAMKVTEQTTLADYFVVMTGTSSTHIRSLSEEIEKKLKDEGVMPHHTEGVTSSWILLDYTTVVVNIFLQEARELYALERLWGDAMNVDIEEYKIKDEGK